MKSLFLVLIFAAFVACGQKEYYQCNCQNKSSNSNQEIIANLNDLLTAQSSDGESYSINNIEGAQYELTVIGEWKYVFDLNDIDYHEIKYFYHSDNYFVMSINAKNRDRKITIQFPHGDLMENHITLVRNTKDEILEICELFCALGCQNE